VDKDIFLVRIVCGAFRSASVCLAILFQVEVGTPELGSGSANEEPDFTCSKVLTLSTQSNSQ
jgi:hypothetical protein